MNQIRVQYWSIISLMEPRIRSEFILLRWAQCFFLPHNWLKFADDVGSESTTKLTSKDHSIIEHT